MQLWSPLPWCLMMVSIFPCSYWQFADLLWKIFIQVLFLSLNSIVSLLWIHFSDWSLFSAQVVTYVSKKGQEVKFHIPHCQDSSKMDKFILNYAAALHCYGPLKYNSVIFTSSGDSEWPDIHFMHRCKRDLVKAWPLLKESLMEGRLWLTSWNKASNPPLLINYN